MSISVNLIYNICHPIKSFNKEDNVNYSDYLSLEIPNWAPDSAKNLLENTQFIRSSEELRAALNSGKTHIVWQAQNFLLLHWKKSENNLWSLKVFCSPPPRSASLSGGIATLMSIIYAYNGSWSSQMSEWTDGLKTRIDPVALSFEKLPGNIFSRLWLEALKKEDWTQLFLPLEAYRASPSPLPKDEAGYKERFMTPARSENNIWWLYKAWMRQNLPLEDYKQYHFLHRFTLFSNYEANAGPAERHTCYEIATKLMRSLLKARCSLGGEIKNQVQQLSYKHEQAFHETFFIGASSIMPPGFIEKKAILQPITEELPSKEVTIPRAPTRLLVSPHQWNQPGQWDSYSPLSCPERDDPIWDISGVRDEEKLDKILELNSTYHLLSGTYYSTQNEHMQLFKRLSIFKRLVAQMSVDLSESLCLIPREDLLWHKTWENPALHHEWLIYYKELIPKRNRVIYREAKSPHDGHQKLPKDESLAKLFLCTLDHKTENDLPENYIELFSSFLPHDTNSDLPHFPKTALFFRKLFYFRAGGLTYDQRLQLRFVDPAHYLAESQVTRGECYDPWNTPLSVVRSALPHISPTQALLNFRQLHEVWKYRAEALKDLMDSFFQEAWGTEELKKNARRGWFGTQPEIDELLIMKARSEASLPWVEALQEPHFQKFLEIFLQDECQQLLRYDHKMFPTLIALMRLSIYAIRVCPTLQVPDFERLILEKTPQAIQLHYLGDRSHQYITNLIQNARLYLFWLYAEQGRPSERFRPLSKDAFEPKYYQLETKYCYDWLSADKKHILHHLKTLPDLPEIERPSEVNIQIIPYVNVPPVKQQNNKTPEPLQQAIQEVIHTPTYENTDPSKMVFPLQIHWWTGEEVVVSQDVSDSSFYDLDNWKLQDRPHLLWRPAQPRSLHGNELVDEQTGNVVAHVFHVTLGEKSYCFSIPFENGDYSPNTLEERLCLLLQYCNANHRSACWQVIQQLPKMTHKLSPIALQLMQQITLIIVPFQATSFENLGLTMQILERFHTWAENPTLNVETNDTLPLTLACYSAWELYRNVQQNVPQQYVLTPIQRQNLSGLLVRKGKELSLKVLEELSIPSRLSHYAKKLIKGQNPISSNTAWNRSIQITALDTAPLFSEKENAIVSQKYFYSSRCAVRDQLGNLKSLALRITCAFLRFLGIRYVWPERLILLQAYAYTCMPYIVTAPLSNDNKLQKRLELAAARQRYSDNSDIQYCFEIADWALVHNIVKHDDENYADFIARVELLKHVHNVFYNLLSLVGVHFVRRIYSWIKSLYAFFPEKVSLHADVIRDPFELYRRKNIYPHLSVDQIGAAITPEQILDLANKATVETRASLAATIQEPIKWSHIEGLFVQNGMKRLLQMNPALTEEECDAIDSSVRCALIDRSRTNYAYNPKENSAATRALLVFEKTTGMHVRADQIEKLQALFTRKPNGNYANSAMQMAMGAGKTSVLASIVLLQAAIPGRISIFVPPAAQFETLATMLTKWQKDRFQQEVIPIQMSFDLLKKESSLEWLHAQLLQAKELGHVLLLHPTTLHNLRLAWLSCEDPDALKVLYAIRSELKEHGDALFDEVDKAQDPLIDSSMAYGDEKQPSMRYLKQFASLILLHEQDPELWNALCKNAPEKINPERYKEFQYHIVAPILAEQFDIPEELRISFARYIVGNATHEQDAAFLEFLDKLETRDEVAQHKHWLEDILPFTIFREKGRHYGRSNSSAEVVPYIGVGAPGTTKFAQVAEEVSYYWLTALSSELDANKFAEVFNSFKFRYERYSRRDNCRVPLEKLCNEYHDITGCDLNIAMKNPHELKTALEIVNASPARKLKCEVFLARNYIRYYETQLTSTSQDASNMFSTRRGFSGTFPGYIHAFDHIVIPDSASDASVIKAMEEHNEPTMLVDHAEDLFEFVKDNRNMGGLIDSGGLFRDFTNDQVAAIALDRLPYIDTVLFFGKASDKDATPDIPMIMQRNPYGGTFIHVIGSTEEHILKAWGVEKERLFVFYDQRHCEATNVKQMPDRLNAITFGLRSTKRDLLQGVMRLRQYKEQGVHQSLVYVMQKDTAKKLFGEEQLLTVSSIIEKSKEIEQEETEKRTFRTFYHRIDSAFCEAVEDYISVHLTGKKCEQLRLFILHHLTDPSPYKQFGAISVECNTVDKLTQYIDTKLKVFAKIYPGTLPSALINKLDEIRHLLTSKEKKNEVIQKCLPEKTLAKQLGQEQQQEIRQEVEQEQQQEQQTVRILPTPGTGSAWTEVCNYKSIKLSDHYGLLFHKRTLVSRDFDAKLFTGLFASENFLHTYKTAYALNHPDQKRANYVLLERKNNRLVATILASYDYLSYQTGKRELPENSCICFWKPSTQGLTQYLKGTLEVQDDEKVQWAKIRLQIAFLNGDVSYIADHLSDLSGPLENEHFLFLKKRVEYWQLQRERREWWWISPYIIEAFGFTVREHQQTNFRRNDYNDRVTDLQGRSWEGDVLWSKPEKNDALQLIAMLESES